MDSHIGLYDILARLSLTVLAGALLGVNRSQRGRAAGLRTTILIGLAAATAMIEANLLLINTHFGAAGDMARFDVMRLPLGILSGIGFIGGGAIVKRNDLVQGVTTAAMLWLMTMIGLVFGAGYYWFGAGVTAVTFVVVWGLKSIERRIPQDHRAVLIVTSAGESVPEAELRSLIAESGMRILAWSVAYLDQGAKREVHCDVGWHSKEPETTAPAFLAGLAHRAGVTLAEWKPQSAEATQH